jgi:plasmid stabilization system protein ParE
MEIQFTLRAILDLEDIHSYIARDDHETADRFVNKLRDSLNVLTIFPYSGKTHDDLPEGLRVFVHRNYLAIYRVTEEAVVIEGVTEGHRNLRGLFGE